MPPSCRCSRPAWTGLWATWSSGRCPCPWQGGWKKIIFKIPSNSNLSVSMISWVALKHHLLLKHLFSSPLTNFVALLWALSLLSASFLNCGDTVLQVQPDKHWVEWDGHISISHSNTPVDAAQDLICLCCCSGTLLTGVQVTVHPDIQLPFSKAAPQSHRS